MISKNNEFNYANSVYDEKHVVIAEKFDNDGSPVEEWVPEESEKVNSDQDDGVLRVPQSTDEELESIVDAYNKKITKLQEAYEGLFNEKYDYLDKQGRMNGQEITVAVENQIGTLEDYINSHLDNSY